MIGNDYAEAPQKRTNRLGLQKSNPTGAWAVGLLLLISLCTNCTGSMKPMGVLSAPQMQLILWDLLKADEYLNEARDLEYRINADSAAEALYQKIFLLHDTDKESFQKSLAYYQGRPDISKPLFDSVAAMGERENQFYITADSIMMAAMEAQRWKMVNDQLWRVKHDSMLRAYNDSMKLNTLSRLSAYWDSSAVELNVNLGSSTDIKDAINADAISDTTTSFIHPKPEANSNDSLSKIRLKVRRDLMQDSIIKKGSSGRTERMMKMRQEFNKDSIQRLNRPTNNL